MPPSKMEWDLRPLVTETEVTGLKGTMERLATEAEQIAADHRGKVGSLDPEGMRLFLERLEAHGLEEEGPLTYARLLYAANSLDPTAKELSEGGRTAAMQIGQALAFAEIELAQVAAAHPSLPESAPLAPYAHLLERLGRRAAHYLPEAEERLIIQKDRFGIDAWYQLQQDWLSTRTFTITVNGTPQELPYGEIIGLYEDPDRELRKAANRTVYAGLGQDEIVWASALRAVLGNHVEMGRRRGWPSPLAPSLSDNDVEEGAIDALMRTVETHVTLFQRYLRLKARLMDLPKLANFDLVAPLPDAPDRTYRWAEAQELVHRAYSSFDPNVAAFVEEMFTKRRIDAAPRKGKRSGAFCARWISGAAGFVLLSYNGRLGDVFTLAHENGHAVHDTFMARNQTLYNTDISACVAETASIFGELLLTDQLIAEAQDPVEKRAVLVKVLDEFGYAVFQVSARFFFERDLYRALREGEYLDGETIARYWTKSREKIYGDSVDWLEEMKWEWTMKPHYYMPRFRFYNYPYVYANLFVFALYRLYQEEGGAFPPKLIALLSAGSSRSPGALAADLGFDILDTDSWAKGMQQTEAFVDELEALLP